MKRNGSTWMSSLGRASFSLATAVALALLAGQAFAGETASGAKQAIASPPPAASRPDAAPAAAPTYTRALIPERPVLAEPFRYELRFRGPAGARIFFPPRPAVGDLQLDELRCVDAREVAGPGGTAEAAAASPRAATPPAAGVPAGTATRASLDTTCTLALRSFRLGRQKLPALEVAWTGKGSEGGTLEIPARRFEVDGRLGNESAPTLRASYAPFPIRERNWPLLIGAILLATVGVTAILTLLLVFALRRFILPRRFAEPKPPAHIIAYGKLEALSQTLGGAGEESADPDAASAWDPVLGREFFFQLSEILREYLGNRYDMDTLELTTAELCERLHDVDLQEVSLDEIEGFLSAHDMVKFARQAAGREEALALLDQGRSMVQRSLYVPVEKPIDPADDVSAALVPSFEHANVWERLAATGLDASLPLPLVLGLHLAWPTLHLAWVVGAWLLLLSLTLCFRDLWGAASPGHRLMGHRLLDERLDLLASSGARLRRNLTLCLPVISWTVEFIVLWRVTGTQRVGDQWAETAVAVASGRASRRLLTVSLLLGSTLALAATALFLGR